MRLAAAAVLALGLSAVAAQPPDDRAKLADAKLAELQGVYELKAMEVGGVAAKPEFLKGRRFVLRRVDGGGYVLAALTWFRVDRKDGKTEDRVVEDPLRLRIDPTRTPTPVDFEEPQDEGKARTTYGIYRFEATADGDLLTLCASDTEDPADRPTEFKTTRDRPKQYLMVLKRVQKGK